MFTIDTGKIIWLEEQHGSSITSYVIVMLHVVAVTLPDVAITKSCYSNITESCCSNITCCYCNNFSLQQLQVMLLQLQVITKSLLFKPNDFTCGNYAFQCCYEVLPS